MVFINGGRSHAAIHDRGLYFEVEWIRRGVLIETGWIDCRVTDFI